MADASREDRRVEYGALNVTYFQDLRDPNRKPVKTLALTNVAQVDIVDDYGLLIILLGKVICSVISYRHLTAFFREPNCHVPAGRTESNGSASRAEARQADRCTHVVRQV